MQGSKLFFVYNDNHIFYILFHCYSDSLYIPRLALSSIFNLIHLLLQRCDNRSIHNTIAHHTFIHPCLLCGDTMAFKVFQLFWYLEFYTSSKLSHVVLKYSWDIHFFLFFLIDSLFFLYNAFISMELVPPLLPPCQEFSTMSILNAALKSSQ